MSQVKLSNLKTKPGSTQEHFRKGIGIGSGNGKRAGRGQKGQGARSGGNKNIGFEGGQLPLYRRFPKVGFTSLKYNQVVAIVNLDQLDKNFKDGDEVNFASLVELNVIKASADKVKILGNGTLTLKNLTVTADGFSKSALKAIEDNGGKAVVIEPKKFVNNKNK